MKRRPDGRWQKRITLPNGKSKLIYSSASTERLAVKDFNEKMLQMEKEEKNRSLFKNIADEWNTDYRKRIDEINYRKGPKATYERILSHFKDRYVEEITATDVHAYINSLIQNQYSQKSISTAKSILNMIFNFAILNGYIINNPVQIITLPANLPKKPRKLPKDEELRIVSENYTGFDFLPYFLLNTGLRKSEALALTYDDIDFENECINVDKVLVYDNDRPVIKPKTKTEKGERYVTLLKRVADKIPRDKKGLIFCNEDGTPFTNRNYDTHWKHWKKKHNVSITAHQLRHAYATMLYEVGVEDLEAQGLMGHADISTTRSIYTHIRSKRKKETAEKLNAFSF